MQDRILISGSSLSTEHMRILIGDIVLTPDLTISDPDFLDRTSDTEISIRLPQRISGSNAPPLNMKAGVNLLQVQHLYESKSGDFRELEKSNGIALVISPWVGRVAINGSVNSGLYTGIVTVKFGHIIGAQQDVSLWLNPLPGNPVATPIAIEAPVRSADGDEITFTISDVAQGNYLYRLSIDGAQTQLGKTRPEDPFDQPSLTLV